MGGERQKRLWAAAVVAVLAAVMAGTAVGAVTPRVAPPVASVIGAVALGGAFVAMLPRWRRLDHMEQDSRLRSWYWGGGFAGALAAVLTLILAGPRSPLFIGTALVWAAQCAGYAAGRMHWWLGHHAAA